MMNIKKLYMFSASLSKVHWIFFIGAMVCAIGMTTACKSGGTPAALDEATANENANDSNLLLGKWQCVESATTWYYDESEDFCCDYRPYHYLVDTGLATLVAFDFIDTNKCAVTYHTHDCEPVLPYMINVDSVKYNKQDIYITIGGGYVSPCDFEIEKLTRDTLVLRCFEKEEGCHCQMRYTFVRK